MKKLSVALLLFIAMGNAHACSCVLVTPAQAKGINDRAFVGQVTNVQNAQSPGKLAISFRISDWIKGPREKESVVLVPVSPAACGYGSPFFILGTTYLVFANQSGEYLETSACSPNQMGRPSKKNLRVLRRGT